ARGQSAQDLVREARAADDIADVVARVPAEPSAPVLRGLEDWHGPLTPTGRLGFATALQRARHSAYRIRAQESRMLRTSEWKSQRQRDAAPGGRDVQVIRRQ